MSPKDCQNCGCEVRIGALERALAEVPARLGRIEKLLVGLVVSAGLGVGGVTLANCGVFRGGSVSYTAPNGQTLTVSAEEVDGGCVELGATWIDDDGETIGAASCAVNEE